MRLLGTLVSGPHIHVQAPCVSCSRIRVHLRSRYLMNAYAIVSVFTDGAAHLCDSQNSEEAQRYAELQAKIAADERLLVQFADEKVQMARQANDLLDMHSTDLDSILEQFEIELQANQVRVCRAAVPQHFLVVSSSSQGLERLPQSYSSTAQLSSIRAQCSGVRLFEPAIPVIASHHSNGTPGWLSRISTASSKVIL